MNSMQDRQPAGTQGAGQWVTMPPKDKGPLPELDLSDSPMTITAMVKAHRMMDTLERGFSLECGQVGDRTWVKGTIIARVTCPRCGGELDIASVEESNAKDALCLDCGRSVDVVSERRRHTSAGQDQDIAGVIDLVVENLKQDFLQERTSGDESDISLRRMGAESMLEYWVQELGFNPDYISSLPVEFLDNDEIPSDKDVTIVINPNSLDIKLYAVRIPSDERDYLDVQTAECELPLDAIKALENGLRGYSTYSEATIGERQMVRDRLALSIKWAELREKEQRIWKEN